MIMMILEPLAAFVIALGAGSVLLWIAEWPHTSYRCPRCGHPRPAPPCGKCGLCAGCCRVFA